MQLHYTLYTLMTALPYVTTTVKPLCASLIAIVPWISRKAQVTTPLLVNAYPISPAPYPLFTELKLILKCN